MQALGPGQEAQKDDSILGHIVVEQDTDRHQACSTGADHSIHQEDVGVVVLERWGQLAVVQLRLAVQGVCLDQDLADHSVTDHAAQANLHRATSTQDRHTADIDFLPKTMDSLGSGCLDCARLVWQFLQSSNQVQVVEFVVSSNDFSSRTTVQFLFSVEVTSQ